MSALLSKRVLIGVVGVATAVTALTIGATAASADHESASASGNTVVQLAPPVVKALANNGCGALSASATGTGSVKITGSGAFQARLPVTGVVASGANGLRIQHAGSGIALSNACLSLRLTNFYIQNFGQADQQETFDVSARTKADGMDAGRVAAFTLDLSNSSQTSTASGAIKVRSANLLLTDDGAGALNMLVTGTPMGPFYGGEQAGKARTTIRFGSDMATAA